MALNLITYDLNKPGQDYKSLIDYLEKLGARRVLLSTWVIRGDYDVAKLRDAIRVFMDGNDRLLVTVMGAWATYNAMVDINTI